MIKILIVDDEKPICDLIDLNLSAAGYFCKSVQDGMKAIELIEKETFDLIFKDPGDLHYRQGRCKGPGKRLASGGGGLSGEAL